MSDERHRQQGGADVGGGEPEGVDRQLTVDCFELRFAVNRLEPFALTQRLLPLLARQLDRNRVTVNSLHPATFMPTKMVLESVGYSIDSLQAGLDATLRMILDPELEGVTGRFFDRTREARAHAHDSRIQQEIWDLSMRLTV